MALCDWGCVVQILPKDDVSEPLNLEVFVWLCKKSVCTIKVNPCMYVCLFVCLFVGWLFRGFLVFLKFLFVGSPCETGFSVNRRGIYVRHSMFFRPM